MNHPQNIKDSWNAVYRPGNKYKNEPPVPFIQTIISTLKKENLSNGKGLYIGCGNGRNFIPLIEQGLDLIGLDISDIALKQISDQKPELKDKLICSDFLGYETPQQFDYIVAIQVFQHGNYDEVTKNFQKAASLLKPNGLFFLRNRSLSNTVDANYEVVEDASKGGQTVKYLSGSKEGLIIHALSKDELSDLESLGLSPLISPYEVKKERTTPHTGMLAHWEGIWKKK